MGARVLDLTVEQGSDFRREFPDGPTNPVGWSGRAAIRRRADRELLYEPTVTVAPGKVTLSIPGRDSDAWTWREAHYEVKVFGPHGQQARVASGRLTVDPSYVH